MDSLAPVRPKVRGTLGCPLFRHLESVDPRVAEGLKRDPLSQSSPANNSNNNQTNGSKGMTSQPSKEELERLVEEEKRRAITDPFQIFLYDTKVRHRKGNFKGMQGDVILSRIRDILDKGAKELNFAGFMLFDDFCMELLAPYLRAKSCKLTSVNLSGTQIGVQGAIAVAKAVAMNPLLQMLQLSSEHPIPALTLRRDAQSSPSHRVTLQAKKYSHLDAAALGILIEKERKTIERLDISENELTGPRTNIFHGISTLFLGLKRCLHLKELNLHCVGLRSEGLVDLANAIQDYQSLETLVLSSNQLACNGFGEKSIAGVEAFCGALWQSKKLTSLTVKNNELDYLSVIPIAKMLCENQVLTAFDLSSNPVDDAGVVHLAVAIKKNASLLSLNLSGCQLRSEAIVELATALRKFNRKLQSIDLRDNPGARSSAYRDLSKCLAINPTISHIELNPAPLKKKKSNNYDKHLEKIRAYIQVNAFLRDLRSGFHTQSQSQSQKQQHQKFDLQFFSEFQRANFVEKLQDLSESELQKFHDSHVVENLRIPDNHEDKEIAQNGASNLRFYASQAQTEQLKHLLWVLETDERQVYREERAERLKTPKRRQQPSCEGRGSSRNGTEDGGEDDGDDVWDYPLC